MAFSAHYKAMARILSAQADQLIQEAGPKEKLYLISVRALFDQVTGGYASARYAPQKEEQDEQGG